MKNLNKLAMGILVGALAIGFSAFNNAKPANSDVADAWFVLKTGVSPTLTNARIASNYQLVASEPCSNGVTYCGIRANNSSGQPYLSTGTDARTQLEDYFAGSPEGIRISAHN